MYSLDTPFYHFCVDPLVWLFRHTFKWMALAAFLLGLPQGGLVFALGAAAVPLAMEALLCCQDD